MAFICQLDLSIMTDPIFATLDPADVLRNLEPGGSLALFAGPYGGDFNREHTVIQFPNRNLVRTRGPEIPEGPNWLLGDDWEYAAGTWHNPAGPKWLGQAPALPSPLQARVGWAIPGICPTELDEDYAAYYDFYTAHARAEEYIRLGGTPDSADPEDDPRQRAVRVCNNPRTEKGLVDHIRPVSGKEMDRWQALLQINSNFEAGLHIWDAGWLNILAQKGDAEFRHTFGDIETG